MLKDITLGQYFPGNSILHRLDPRVKIVLAIMYIVIVFLAKNVWGFAFICAATLLLMLISTIPIGMITRGLKPLIFIIAFTALFNVFGTQGEKLLFEYGFIHVYAEGIAYALLMIVRVIALLSGTSVILTYTTSPIQLTDGLERLLSPLKVFKLQVHEFAMMMTIALRFIPTLVEETEKIMNAQKARGVDFSQGNLIKRAKALVPILIPLFISAFRRAEELAISMECRCYRGGEGRTRMKELHMHLRDVTALVICVACGAAVVAINRFAPGFVI